MSYNSLEEIVRECQEKDLPFDEVILLDDMNERNVSREESIETMRGMWEAMKGAERNYDGSLQSRSGLVGGAGKTMRTYVESGNTLCGPFVGKVMASALAMGESNACMKRIVAAPTAGACGVLPAVLVNYQKEKGTADEQIVRALYTAAGIGQVVAARAYIAGASGGCQAEIGTASAMAAGALTALGGGTPSQITHAAAMALKNLLGLVCDPVGGLVEVPCVKRNVIGSVNALSAADMALAGIISRIPPDQVIDAMREVGDQMHPSLRETGQGGLANTPAARESHHNRQHRRFGRLEIRVQQEGHRNGSSLRRFPDSSAAAFSSGLRLGRCQCTVRRSFFRQALRPRICRIYFMAVIDRLSNIFRMRAAFQLVLRHQIRLVQQTVTFILYRLDLVSFLF